MADVAIRVVKSFTNDTIYYGNNDTGDKHGSVRPIITSWPLDNSAIRVTTATSTGANGTSTYLYDGVSLDYTQTVSRASPGDDFPEQIQISTIANGRPIYRPIGIYISNGTSIPLWFYQPGTVNSTGIKPAIAAGSVYLGTSDWPETSNNLAYDAGVPVDLYVGGASLSRDQKSLFLFTSPSALSGNVIDTWYKIVDSVVVDEGTVTPKLDSTAIGYGVCSLIHYRSNSFENNGKWMWTVYGAGSNDSSGGCSCYKIDPANNFAFITVGQYEGHTLLLGTEDSTFFYPSVMSLRTGYCGVVANDVVAIFSRLGASPAVQPSIRIM